MTGVIMARVEIYSTAFCPYCHRAKGLLTAKGVAFEENDVTMDPKGRAAMTERAGGSRTVPQIFINGSHIGGCDDLHELDANGTLDTLLAA
jgi:glutaredoxin 3